MILTKPNPSLGRPMTSDLPTDPIKKLITIMMRLRSPQGCPWDRLQSPDSLKPYLLEEAYEVLAVLGSEQTDDIRDELGDLLLQIVFLAEIHRERGDFDFDEIAESICAKLIRRHPHVFADIEENDLTSLDRQWDAIKRSESGNNDNSALANLPENLPALLQAQKSSVKVARVGFDWPDADSVLAQLEDEIRELRDAIRSDRPEEVRAEIGDILFTVTNLARHLGQDAETALLEMNSRFRKRFQIMERIAREQGQDLEQLSIDDLNVLWQQAKAVNRE